MNSVCRQKQTGAITLIGALFIIITLALMGNAINLMTTSSITDTTAQNDSVEALFIAETGIEYASYLYANGTSCIDLKTSIANISSARGSFDITEAILIGTECKISVHASVSSVGAGAPSASLRKIDANLRLESATGWAVGDNGAILKWDGINWVTDISNTTQDLYSIHCETNNDCWAVGSNAVTIHWDGSNWSPVLSNTTGLLLGVSCDAGDFCYSVGAQLIFGFLPIANTRHWNGSAWIPGNGTAFFNYYSDVSCPSSNCYATMGDGSVRQSTTSWGTVFPGTITLNGIDCKAANDCWAVGNLSGNNFYFVHYDGTSWSSQLQSAPNNEREDLNAISCATANDCWAVGNRKNSRYILVQWDGSNWSRNPLQNGQHREDLNGVHCPTSNECWAVGVQRNGWNIIHYDGTSWNYFGSGASGTENLNDVFVFSGGGSVSLVRWQEQISN